jgi:hypothetical protein
VVAQFGDKTYLATVTVQTTAADNPNYVRDCHDNPQGIQVLPPAAFQLENLVRVADHPVSVCRVRC